MGKRAKSGICYLCGSNGQLSFEHVPPQAAFNKGPARLSRGYDLIQSIGLTDFEKMKTRICQKGSGAHTLCKRCNNNTGDWYVKAYVDWVYQAAVILKLSNNTPTLFYQFKIFPLRVIKQIICMFFSVIGPSLRVIYPELEKFVLDTKRKYINKKLKIFCYYNPSTIGRQSGVSGIVSTTGSMKRLSEISYFPFGYILLIESDSYETNLQDISFFANYEYDDWKEISLRIPSHEIYTWYPADFRTKENLNKEFKT